MKFKEQKSEVMSLVQVLHQVLIMLAVILEQFWTSEATVGTRIRTRIGILRMEIGSMTQMVLVYEMLDTPSTRKRHMELLEIMVLGIWPMARNGTGQGPKNLACRQWHRSRHVTAPEVWKKTEWTMRPNVGPTENNGLHSTKWACVILHNFLLSIKSVWYVGCKKPWDLAGSHKTL